MILKIDETTMFVQEFNMKLVKIEWEDSKQPISSSHFLRDLKTLKVSKCVSVGFLLQDNENVKILAPNIADLDDEESIQAAGVMTIPTGCVTKITELREI